jgi:serine O-acetyltransferase
MQSDKIGVGLVMQHGFSTIIEAVAIGKECQIWHNVTIGTNISNTGNKATIGDNVKICTGSMVLGRITIGNNVTIGAGCVVVKDVPSNCVVVGNPATIVKLNGERVNIPL